MSDTIALTGRPMWALTAAGAACLLWLLYAATAADPLLGQYPVHPAIEAVAVLSTALFFILGGSVLLLAFLPGGLRATALQRMLVHALLTFIAVYVVLSYYGWDLRAVLTTSAIVTAAIGFAMQPTLGSVISGVVLNMDYRLRVGDGIIRGGEAIEIESLGWRNVVGRKSNGQLVVFPNARLADAEVEFVPAGRPVRRRDIHEGSDRHAARSDRRNGGQAAGRSTGTRSQPRAERHAERVRPGRASTQSHCIRYWVSDYRGLASIESRIQARLWYGLQRAGLYVPPAAPEPNDPNDPLAWSQHPSIASLIETCRPELTAEAARALAEGSEFLLFGRGERIELPSRMKGWSFLVLRGELACHQRSERLTRRIARSDRRCTR